jgi:uncharacterized integral membrane protein (TIGR00698 family)
VSGTSALIWALAIGAVIANTGLLRPSFAPGIRYASRNVLRIGVALLGIRLSLGTIGDLGLRTIVVILGSICVTFAATLLIGRLLGVSGPLTLLIATGTGICGASAIVAMESVSEASREEAAFALATITALGTVAMVGAPLLRTPLGLGSTDFGIWSGASIHEVAQVVGATAGVSAVALKIGTLVKLARVAPLAPLVFGYAVSKGAGAGLPARRSCRCSSLASSCSRACAPRASCPVASSPTSRASTCSCSRPAWRGSGWSWRGCEGSACGRPCWGSPRGW